MIEIYSVGTEKIDSYHLSKKVKASDLNEIVLAHVYAGLCNICQHMIQPSIRRDMINSFGEYSSTYMK